MVTLAMATETNEVLEFLRRHPFAKFGIAGSGDVKKSRDVEKALESLVQANVVEKRVQKGLSVYSLNPMTD
ncbi:MAG: hypothetical protein DRI39_02305 [Chloroflexi bacterium]|nr:MAG: hypothetical protein DRI39_02305 [Chloroflexota bacterium]RLC95170.1 MAG: hypothetical protein DRI40_06410 [Chloroflexota bacterium]